MGELYVAADENAAGWFVKRDGKPLAGPFDYPAARAALLKMAGDFSTIEARLLTHFADAASPIRCPSCGVRSDIYGCFCDCDPFGRADILSASKAPKGSGLSAPCQPGVSDKSDEGS